MTPLAKGAAPSAPTMAQPAAAPASPPKGKDTVQDGATSSLTSPSPSKEKGEPAVDSGCLVVNPLNPLSAIPCSFLEGVNLSDINETTLTADFEVGRNMSFYSFHYMSSGARSALPMGVAPKSMFGCMQPSIDSNWSVCLTSSFFFP